MNNNIKGLVYGASLVSIFLSIYMFATGKRETGIFIGLWAPTFLGLGTMTAMTGTPGLVPIPVSEENDANK